MLMKLPTRDGFTLIEVLIAMTIIGILAAFSVAMLWRSKDRAYESSMASDLRTMVTEQERYFAANNQYSADFDALPNPVRSPGVEVTITYAEKNGWAATSVHPSVEGRICGIRVGQAPLSAAEVAVSAGYVQCAAAAE